MGKIVQIIDSFYDERLSFRICEVVGTYNNPFAHFFTHKYRYKS